MLLGVAIYVTALPLSITFNRSGYNGLLIQDWAERAVIIVLAASIWLFRISGRLRRPGA